MMRLLFAFGVLLGLASLAPAGDCYGPVRTYVPVYAPVYAPVYTPYYNAPCADLYDGAYHWQAAGWWHDRWYPAGNYCWRGGCWHLRGYGPCYGYATSCCD